MKKLLAIGDSFTYGEELADINNAWPYVLGHKLGYEVTNLSKPASSNYRMLRCLLEEDINKYDLVIIAWSIFDRLEVADEIGIYDIWPGGKRTLYRNQASWRGDFINYLSRHHNDDYLYRQYLMNIIYAQSYLKSNDKKYILLDAFYNHVDQRRFDPKNNDLINKIDTTHYLGWPDESMMEWTKGLPTGDLWAIPRGPKGHFLEEGHQIVAEKIYNKACTIL